MLPTDSKFVSAWKVRTMSITLCVHNFMLLQLLFALRMFTTTGFAPTNYRCSRCVLDEVMTSTGISGYELWHLLGSLAMSFHAMDSYLHIHSFYTSSAIRIHFIANANAPLILPAFHGKSLVIDEKEWELIPNGAVRCSVILSVRSSEDSAMTLNWQRT
mgnify:CR=1 FL=1